MKAPWLAVIVALALALCGLILAGCAAPFGPVENHHGPAGLNL